MSDETQLSGTGERSPAQAPISPACTDRSDKAPIVNPAAKQSPDAFFDQILRNQPDMVVGQAIRAVREYAGLNLSEVAKEIRIGEKYLMAIERMEPNTLPSGYLGPYLGAYCSRLGLDRNKVVPAYTDDTGTVDTINAPEEIPLLEAPKVRKWVVPAFAAAAMGCLAGLSAMIFMVTRPDPALQEAMSGNPALNGARESLFAQTPLPERVEIAALPLTLHAVRDGWIEVRGADGTIFRSRVMRTGETYIPRLGAGWTVSARDGGAFEWHVGDLVVGPLGPESAPVFASSVDAAAAKAAETASPAMAAAGNGQPSR